MRIIRLEESVNGATTELPLCAQSIVKATTPPPARREYHGSRDNAWHSTVFTVHWSNNTRDVIAFRSRRYTSRAHKTQVRVNLPA